MTLTDIKEKIVGQLSKMTIDDLYTDRELGFAQLIFSEITGLKKKVEFTRFLSERVKETVKENPHESTWNVLVQANMNFKKQIVTINNEMKHLQSKIDNFNTQLTIKKENQNKIPKQLEITKSLLIEIETEIKQIKQLAGKPPYDKQMVELEKNKDKRNTELNGYLSANSIFKTELEEIPIKIKLEKEIVAQKQSEIKFIETSIINNEKELETLSKKVILHYQKEYSSVQFLFITLLNKSFSDKIIYEERKTGKIIVDERGIEFDEYVKTGKESFDINTCAFNEQWKLILSLTKTKNTTPKNWREILYMTLSRQIAEIVGNLNYEIGLSNNGSKLTHLDQSMLLATKIAVRTNYSIKTADNKIVLALSGGFLAIISYREKGDLITKFQKESFEIYRINNTQEDFVLQTLYFQTGYANSEIKIKTPEGFYIIIDKYFIEIHFAPAPILFDSNSVIKLTPNISGKAKLEEEKRKEEKRKKNDDDWDDDWDYI